MVEEMSCRLIKHVSIRVVSKNPLKEKIMTSLKFLPNVAFLTLYSTRGLSFKILSSSTGLGGALYVARLESLRSEGL